MAISVAFLANHPAVAMVAMVSVASDAYSGYVQQKWGLKYTSRS